MEEEGISEEDHAHVNHGGNLEEDDAYTVSDDEENASQHENGITDEGYLADDEDSDNDVTPAQAPNPGHAEVVMEEENAVLEVEDLGGVIIELEYPHVQVDILVMLIDTRGETPPEL